MRNTVASAAAALLAAVLPAGPGLAQERAALRSGIVVSDADRVALFDARMAICKVVLKMTPAQEALWPQTEAALREAAAPTENAARAEAAAQAADDDTAEPLAHLRARAARHAASAERMRRLADAIEPLYNQLEPDQRRCFARLLSVDELIGLHTSGSEVRR